MVEASFNCETTVTELNSKITKYFSLLFLSLIITLLSGNLAYGLDPTLTLTSCSTSNDGGNASEFPYIKTYTRSCTVNVTANGNSNIKVGVYSGSSTTNYRSGHGSNINYTTLSRFKVTGGDVTLQNIPSSGASSPLFIKTGISSDTNFSVSFYYKTYEADYGGTEYYQDFSVELYDSGSNEYSPPAVVNDSIDPINIDSISYITSTGTPSGTFTANEALKLGGTGSKTFDACTISAYANNTWSLKAKFGRLPTNGTETIPVSKVYYQCGGTGFVCVPSNPTFANVALTDYEIAHNDTNYPTDYTTGSSDGMSLSSKTVSVTYKVITDTNLYTKGDYTLDNPAHPLTYTITSP